MVKGMSSIYESLEYFITEELLDDDNKYDAGKYGKQVAYRGIKLYSLPPVLMIQLKRFEYDFLKDTMIKISDSCEFYDEIDLKPYVDPGFKLSTQYKLFSVLVHSGSSGRSGHYYSFIRPVLSICS
jgi:ubiquitin carboxyl-terminal hydrolase 7